MVEIGLMYYFVGDSPNRLFCMPARMWHHLFCRRDPAIKIAYFAYNFISAAIQLFLGLMLIFNWWTGILVVMGILLLTGKMTDITTWLTRIFGGFTGM